MKNLKGEFACLETVNIKPNFSDLGRYYHLDRRTVKKKYLNIRANRQGIMFCSYCDDEEQLTFGYSGGPLIDQTGQVLGVTSSSVRFRGQNNVDVFSSVVDGYNRAFLEEVVKNQHIVINGIE